MEIFYDENRVRQDLKENMGCVIPGDGNTVFDTTCMKFCGGECTTFQSALTAVENVYKSGGDGDSELRSKRCYDRGPYDDEFGLYQV